MFQKTYNVCALRMPLRFRNWHTNWFSIQLFIPYSFWNLVWIVAYEGRRSAKIFVISVAMSLPNNHFKNKHFLTHALLWIFCTVYGPRTHCHIYYYTSYYIKDFKMCTSCTSLLVHLMEYNKTLAIRFIYPKAQWV